MRYLIVLLLGLIVSFNAFSNSLKSKQGDIFVNNKNGEVFNLEKKIEKLRLKISKYESKMTQNMIDTQFFDPQYVDEEMLSLKERLADLSFKLAEKQGRNIDLSSKSHNKLNSFALSMNSNITPETGDILILNRVDEYAEWWAFAGHQWQHAVVFHSQDTILEAPGPNMVSRKVSFSDFKKKHPGYKIEQAILIKMGLSEYQKNSFKFYNNEFQTGVPYPSVSMIPFTKYSVDTFYCSSLVWAAHKWSAKKIDLDPGLSFAMVWPVELLSAVDMGATAYTISWGLIITPS